MVNLNELAEQAKERNPEHSTLEFTLERALAGDQRIKESFIELITKLK